MAGKADFTEDEWETMHRGVTGAGMLVALSDPGFTDSFKESSAMAKHMAGAQTTATSQLVRELAAVRGTGWKVMSKPQEVRDGTVAALSSSVAVLTTKAPDDVENYRAFVVELAQAVAAAASGGDEVESAAIATIRDALGS